MLFTSIDAVIKKRRRAGDTEGPISLGPFALWPAVQLAGLFQCYSTGLRFHVALPACTPAVHRAKWFKRWSQDTMRDFMRHSPMAPFESKGFV